MLAVVATTMPVDEVFVPDRVAVVLAVVIIEVNDEVTEVASFDDDDDVVEEVE